jgi:hypothetical protein
MREQRLTAETTRAKKEMSFYEQKRELSHKINKIEQSRLKSIEKLDQKQSKAVDQDEIDEICIKKQKNLEKMFKY